MIKADDLARLKIKRAIFDDVPSRPKAEGGEPILADLEHEISGDKAKLTPTKAHYPSLRFKARLRDAFRGRARDTSSAELRAFTSKQHTSEEFVAMSRNLANYLYAQHTGANLRRVSCA